MRLSVFSTKPYDKRYLDAAYTAHYASSGSDIDISYLDFALNEDTVSLVTDTDAVCIFVNDSVTSVVIESLAKKGVSAILLRCAGYNHVDLVAAEKAGIMVANVPSYSPEAVAEFAVALIQTLNRRTHRAYNRVREGNFALEGLLGRTLFGKTVGIIGSGRIGVSTARIMKGFGCNILACDPYPNPDMKELGEYKELDELLGQADIISLHCPLMDSTNHIINDETISKMKKGVMVVNTSRGGLVDTSAVIKGLKSGHLGALALDVYEREGELFYSDHSADIIQDDGLMRLMTFPNVLITGHQAFFTEEALQEIAECTLSNFTDLMADKPCKNSLTKGESMKRHDAHPVRNV